VGGSVTHEELRLSVREDGGWRHRRPRDIDPSPKVRQLVFPLAEAEQLNCGGYYEPYDSPDERNMPEQFR
jgi:hypothetical protein